MASSLILSPRPDHPLLHHFHGIKPNQRQSFVLLKEYDCHYWAESAVCAGVPHTLIYNAYQTAH